MIQKAEPAPYFHIRQTVNNFSLVQRELLHKRPTFTSMNQSCSNLCCIPLALELFYSLLAVVAGGGRLDPTDKRVEELGRLEMSWKTLLGEPGRLHSVVSLQQVIKSNLGTWDLFCT